MASSKDRQRALARAKLDRQMARRAGRLRQRRRVQAGVGAAAAVLLIVAGAVWFTRSDNGTPADPTAGDQCLWTPQDATANTNLKDVGTPPTKGLPDSGTQAMTITTNQGAPIVVSLDLAAAKCGAADLAYLAGRKFYDNTDCHELTTEGALHCGDPTGTGQGGPTYSVYSENLPQQPTPAPSASAGAKKPVAVPLYPKGTVALVGNPPGTNGSQFLIFFKDFNPTATPQYSIVGTVTSGLDTLAKIGKIPTVSDPTGIKVKPKEKITIQSLTVGVPGVVPTPPVAPSASSQS